MGIVGIPLQIQVIGCTHLQNGKAFWAERADGTVIPDLFYEGLPAKGRMLLTNQTIYAVCWACRDSLDVIVKEHGKTWLQ